SIAEIRVELAFVDDRRQVLLGEPDVRRRAGALVPAEDVDPPIAVLDHGRDPVHHPFHERAAVDQTGVRGFQGEAAVEAGCETVSPRWRNLGATAVFEFGRLLEARNVGEAGPLGVDPGDAGDEVGVFGIAAESGEQDRGSRPNAGSCLLPYALARERGV